MKTNKPYVLLDIDGVLSPLGATTPEALIHNNGWATFAVPFDVIEFLHRISSKVTFVSSSSWQQDGASLFRNMFIQVEEYLDFADASPDWAKAKTLEAWIKAHQDRPVIILDDEFTPAFLQLATAHENVTCVHVEGVQGLTLANIKMIETLVSNYSEDC